MFEQQHKQPIKQAIFQEQSVSPNIAKRKVEYFNKRNE